MRICQFDANRDFIVRAEAALRGLFAAALHTDELNFAASLSPEFRPYLRNSAVDAQYAFSDYSEYLSRHTEPELRPRVALAFYSHLAEASGFWEIVKNLIGVSQGMKFNVMPFAQFTSRYGAAEGSPIPNANRLMRSLVRSALDAGLTELSETFEKAFDADLRNAFAHADYSLSPEGVVVLSRYAQERVISWQKLNELLDRAIHLYLILNDIRIEHCLRYTEVKTVLGALSPNSPAAAWQVHFLADTNAMVLSAGEAMIQFASYPNLPVFSLK